MMCIGRDPFSFKIAHGINFQREDRESTEDYIKDFYGLDPENCILPLTLHRPKLSYMAMR